MGSVLIRREDLVGVKNVLFNSEEKVKKVVFLVTPWFAGGDLAKRIGDLSLNQITKILGGIIYGLYTVYRYGKSCVADLKPPNVLLDETDNASLADFANICTEGHGIGGDGSSAYHDSTPTASHKRDVFAYGVITFELLTTLVDGHTLGCMFAKRIQDYQNEHIDLVEYVKPQLKCRADYKEEKAKALLDLGARCLKINYDERLTALEVINELNEKNEFDVVDL